MPPKTIKTALVCALEDLEPEDFGKFCHQLLDRREEPRIRRNKVRGKNFMEIADVLVSTFTEPVAVRVAVEILKDIDCNDEAKALEEVSEEISGQSLKPGNTPSSGTASPSAGATGGNPMAEDKHFVDQHMTELIQKISHIDPLLDELFSQGVMHQEIYDQIRAESTPQRKVRALYNGPLKASVKCKDIFYNLLVKYEKYLIQDLQK